MKVMVISFFLCVGWARWLSVDHPLPVVRYARAFFVRSATREKRSVTFERDGHYGKPTKHLQYRYVELCVSRRDKFIEADRLNSSSFVFSLPKLLWVNGFNQSSFHFRGSHATWSGKTRETRFGSIWTYRGPRIVRKVCAKIKIVFFGRETNPEKNKFQISTCC